jgi:hypothetical protein
MEGEEQEIVPQKQGLEQVPVDPVEAARIAAAQARVSRVRAAWAVGGTLLGASLAVALVQFGPLQGFHFMRSERHAQAESKDLVPDWSDLLGFTPMDDAPEGGFPEDGRDGYSEEYPESFPPSTGDELWDEGAGARPESEIVPADPFGGALAVVPGPGAGGNSLRGRITFDPNLFRQEAPPAPSRDRPNRDPSGGTGIDPNAGNPVRIEAPPPTQASSSSVLVSVEQHVGGNVAGSRAALQELAKRLGGRPSPNTGPRTGSKPTECSSWCPKKGSTRPCRLFRALARTSPPTAGAGARAPGRDGSSSLRGRCSRIFRRSGRSFWRGTTRTRRRFATSTRTSQSSAERSASFSSRKRAKGGPPSR